MNGRTPESAFRAELPGASPASKETKAAKDTRKTHEATA
jgi:hypothetical protein